MFEKAIQSIEKRFGTLDEREIERSLVWVHLTKLMLILEAMGSHGACFTAFFKNAEGETYRQRLLNISKSIQEKSQHSEKNAISSAVELCPHVDEALFPEILEIFLAEDYKPNVNTKPAGHPLGLQIELEAILIFYHDLLPKMENPPPALTEKMDLVLMQLLQSVSVSIMTCHTIAPALDLRVAQNKGKGKKKNLRRQANLEAYYRVEKRETLTDSALHREIKKKLKDAGQEEYKVSRPTLMGYLRKEGIRPVNH